MQTQQQPQVKGFRAGKQPKSLSKKALKRQMPEMNKAQEKLVDLFADRTPEQGRKLIAGWQRTTLVVGLLLSVLTVFAWMWSWIAGVGVGVLAAGAFFVHFQVRSQRSQLEQMAEQVSRATRGR
jgi:hypothetical protein